jgi:AmmeMemoRadiSam system protein B
MLRQPAVAGRFYPADPAVLRADVKSYLSPPQERIRAIGCTVPHAGYIYSGQVAGAVFSRMEIPQRSIVLCPNHTGRGHPLAVMDKGEWQTPLGNVEIDSDLAGQLLDTFPALAEDSDAHRSEHAIEVELPFLQVLRPGAKFVPIAVGTARPLLLENLGEAIANVIQDSGIQSGNDSILIIASSDMNHYEDDATTRVKDRKAIDKILALDPQGLYETVVNESISMCGFGPAVVMLTAAKKLGASKAELVQYATSADVSGDRDMVVGYAGIVVT